VTQQATAAERQRLRELVDGYDLAQNELDQAKLEKKAQWVENCAHAIKVSLAQIHAHCEKTGLGIPHGIPARSRR
jgi:hypothetical protein